MAAKPKVEFIISARDMTRAAFRRIRRGFLNMRTALVGLTSAIGFGALARGALDFATSIESASKRLNVSQEELQALKIIAEDNNVAFETLASVLQRLARNADAANEGNSQLYESFLRLGVSGEQIARGVNNPVQLFLDIADAVSAAGDNAGSLRAELARVGDTEAVRLLGILSEGRSGLAQQFRDLAEQGRIQSRETIQDQARAEAAIRREMVELERQFAQVLVEILPLLLEVVRRLNELLERQERGGLGTAIRETAAEIPGVRPIQEVSGGFGVAAFEAQLIVRNLLERIASSTETTAREQGRLEE